MSEHVSQIITFSGIDGAGKTTQIESASTHLVQLGYRVQRVAFWDDVAVLPRFRAGVSLRVLSKQKPKAAGPTLRSDKNVQVWYLTIVRAFFYLLDAFRLRSVIRNQSCSNADFIIFDRYIYDQIVQVRSRNWLARSYVRLLLAVVPVPDFGFILDADPETAFRRKAEYPLSFLFEYRTAFLNLRNFVPQLTVIAPGDINDVQQQILERILLEPSNSKNKWMVDSPESKCALSDFH